MRARKHIELLFIGILLGGLLLSGCKPDEPTQQITLPISICLPAGEVYAAKAPEQRAFGDPGTTEQFALPTHIYIYIVKELKIAVIFSRYIQFLTSGSIKYIIISHKHITLY